MSLAVVTDSAACLTESLLGDRVGPGTEMEVVL